jgi:crotonobetainyl-CoA:carnitine CoA-transferase CaiB-like acyl-CoA transferase
VGQELGGVSELKVIDLGFGMGAALAAKLLVEAGAQVTRIAPPVGDPFDAVYPAQAIWRAGEEVRELADLDELLAEADL